MQLPISILPFNSLQNFYTSFQLFGSLHPIPHKIISSQSIDPNNKATFIHFLTVVFSHQQTKITIGQLPQPIFTSSVFHNKLIEVIPIEPHYVVQNKLYNLIFQIEKQKYILMDRLLEQKKKSEANFRLKINDFISKSQYARKHNQFTANVLHEVLTTTPIFEGIVTNGKVNIQKLCERVSTNDPHCNAKDLLKVLGNKKQMKINQFQLVLKSYQLHEFDLQQQITHLLFEGNNLSLKKLDTIMTSLSMPVLNPKDRQLLIECLDFNHDGEVTHQDLKQLMELCKIRSQESKSTLFKS